MAPSGRRRARKKPVGGGAFEDCVRKARAAVKPFMRKRKGSYKYAPTAAAHKPWHRYLVGTSGFAYPHWRGKFYPDGLHQADEFFHYAKKFNAVELNGTFYGTPEASTFDFWRERASKASGSGKPFVYSVKANQFFTHKKKMNVDEDFKHVWNDFWKQCLRLGDHLGCILFQFPASFRLTVGDADEAKAAGKPKPTLQRLEDLGNLLATDGRFAFEFRDPSWYKQPPVLDLFRRYNWCFCLVDCNNKTGWAGRMDSGPNPPPEKYPITCDWGTYFRFHGLQGQYVGSYGSMLCKRMALQMHKHTVNSDRSAFAFFNNTDDGSPLASALLDANNLQESARPIFDEDS
mmetsp:Transcript_92696/g.246266  ORF Transcript_92696/g.246266 Transcript_92696/m.246266 type:complete len:346 (-) Transcript_92696:81-1118(-)